MTRWQRAFAALALGVPVNANAQVPVYPNQPEAPVNLDPSKSGNQIPDRPQPAPQPSKPNVVIVGPDGKVIGGDSQPGTPNDGYYVSERVLLRRHGRAGLRRSADDPQRADAGAPRRPLGRHAVGHLLVLLQRSVAVAEDLVVQPADHEPALDLSR